MFEMVKIKYGWKKEFEEKFKTEEEAINWVNKILKEQEGGDAEQYDNLTDIEMDVYEIFGDAGAKIEY